MQTWCFESGKLIMHLGKKKKKKSTQTFEHIWWVGVYIILSFSLRFININSNANITEISKWKRYTWKENKRLFA